MKTNRKAVWKFALSLSLLVFTLSVLSQTDDVWSLR